ncbi:MAG: hypothetical protein APF84_01745 [Gracilibacter sp. BRH_c7a]|nr:MAG: hypothetical protein APF84_01745 [Gracilibacter sp. BRH_c7a]
MSYQQNSDFEIGYNYVRRRYSFLSKKSPQYLWELGTAYLIVKGATAELSRGMGFYFLELGVKMFLSETALALRREDDFYAEM